jgi:hypothetical protein
MSRLRHLRHLTSLVVGGWFFDDGCSAGLVEVTGLRKLTVIEHAQYKELKPDRILSGSCLAPEPPQHAQRLWWLQPLQ